MSKLRDIFVDSARRRRVARRQYDERLGLRTRLERETAAYNARRGSQDRERFVWADRVFTVGMQKELSGDGKTIMRPQTISETLDANRDYLQGVKEHADRLDRAAFQEYQAATVADEGLNSSAVSLFSQGAGHRRNKFTRRLYRAWLRGQPQSHGTLEDPIWEQNRRTETMRDVESADEAADRAAVLGGRSRRKRTWPKKR